MNIHKTNQIFYLLIISVNLFEVDNDSISNIKRDKGLVYCILLIIDIAGSLTILTISYT